MKNRPTLTAHAPILLTKNILAASGYFQEKVGFSLIGLYGDPADFGILERDGNHIMLAQVDENKEITPHWKIRDMMWNIYFWVDDIDALYEELQERGADIDYTLYTAPHGAREFGIQDLDGHDIAFGEIVEDAGEDPPN